MIKIITTIIAVIIIILLRITVTITITIIVIPYDQNIKHHICFSLKKAGAWKFKDEDLG